MMQRQNEIFAEHYNHLTTRTDLRFRSLLIFQFLLGLALALWLSPKTWAGGESEIHVHVWAALFLGGLAAGFPIFLVSLNPGAKINRYVIAIAQMLFGTLFIHLTGGRIETHFHVFVSLAALSYYRDVRVLLVAVAVTATDHFLRGYFWPESIYGVLTASPLRALEHAGWVAFETGILISSMKSGMEELRKISRHQAELETAIQNVETIVEKRTLELLESRRRIVEQQESLIYSSKMSALGEMAGGVAHEINTPLAIISLRVSIMEESLKEERPQLELLTEGLTVIERTAGRIGKIVSGLRFFAREAQTDMYKPTKISLIVEETLNFCTERFTNHGVTLTVEDNGCYREAEIECRSVEISQVLLNLLNNAYDAVDDNIGKSKWIHIDVTELNDDVMISVSDNGHGVAPEIANRIMEPFFTTKDIGSGTGLGLSVSKGIVDAHGGRLLLDTRGQHTKFTMIIPKKQMKASA